MKYKIVRILGVLQLVLGLSIIIFQLASKEKSVIGSIASGGPSISIGAGLIVVSFRLERKNAAARGEAPKSQ